MAADTLTMRSVFTTAHEFQRAYHLTGRAHVDAILADGLMLDRSDDYYQTAEDAGDFYGFIPVYASLHGPWEFEHGHADPVLLQFDIAGLAVGIDVPALGDEGAVYGARGLFLEMCSQDVPDALFGPENPMAAGRDFSHADLSDPAVIAAAVNFTESLAVGEGVEPGRISVASDDLQTALRTINCEYWSQRLRRRLN